MLQIVIKREGTQEGGEGTGRQSRWQDVKRMHIVGERERASKREELLLMIHNGSILFVFQIPPNRKYILTRPPQIPSQHAPIRLRQ